MRSSQLQPTVIAKSGGKISRIHNVGEQHGGQNPVQRRRGRSASEKLLDLLKYGFGVHERRVPVSSRELHILAAGDVLGQIPAHWHPIVPILRTMHPKSLATAPPPPWAFRSDSRAPEACSRTCSPGPGFESVADRLQRTTW